MITWLSFLSGIAFLGVSAWNGSTESSPARISYIISDWDGVVPAGSTESGPEALKQYIHDMSESGMSDIVISGITYDGTTVSYVNALQPWIDMTEENRSDIADYLEKRYSRLYVSFGGNGMANILAKEKDPHSLGQRVCKSAVSLSLSGVMFDFATERMFEGDLLDKWTMMINACAGVTPDFYVLTSVQAAQIGANPNIAHNGPYQHRFLVQYFNEPGKYINTMDAVYNEDIDQYPNVFNLEDATGMYNAFIWGDISLYAKDQNSSKYRFVSLDMLKTILVELENVLYTGGIAVFNTPDYGSSNYEEWVNNSLKIYCAANPMGARPGKPTMGREAYEKVIVLPTPKMTADEALEECYRCMNGSTPTYWADACRLSCRLWSTLSNEKYCALDENLCNCVKNHTLTCNYWPYPSEEEEES